MPEKTTNKNKNSNKNNLNDYAKYSGIAIQMGVIIFVGVLGGKKIDEYFSLKTPIFTLILSLLSVGFAIYISIKDFIKKWVPN